MKGPICENVIEENVADQRTSHPVFSASGVSKKYRNHTPEQQLSARWAVRMEIHAALVGRASLLVTHGTGQH